MTDRETREDRPAAGPGQSRHAPVLLREVMTALAPAAGSTYIDGTFGAGGYTRAILSIAGTRVAAFDRDPTAIAAAAPMFTEFADRLQLIEAPFSTLAEEVEARSIGDLAGVVLDIGVSSMQIDEPERGFSFQVDGPLDMRMSRAGTSAADVVNTYEPERIADILYQFGEERRSRAIARAIAARRVQRPITTTLDLADVVGSVLGRHKIDGRNPATRTFQALRIYINDELSELEQALAGAERVLPPGGRLVVVTFHSIEDRIVKRFFAERCRPEPAGSRHLPGAASAVQPSFQFVNRKPVNPGPDEIAANPRARSAKLRAAVRTEAPPHPG